MGLRLVLLGPPGSGKGTLAKRLEEHLAIPHLSTGELFRREMDQSTRLGNRVRQYVTGGGLVPDRLVVEVMTQQLSNRNLRQGFVLDGFPRTVGQAQGLDRFLLRHRRPLEGALYLSCPASVLVSRLSGRRVCSRCGTNYHIKAMPPTRPGICDRCGKALIIRKDDQVATIKKRLAVDGREAKPLLAYYRRKGILYRLSGTGSSPRVLERALELFRRRGWLKKE